MKTTCLFAWPRLALTLPAILALSAAANAAPCQAQPTSPFIVVDQFGYTPSMAKIAIIRDPYVGFDAKAQFEPGPTLQVVDVATCKVVLEGAPQAWQKGRIDLASGDSTWHFDFSALREAGRYIVRDPEKNAVSPEFAIGPNPYRQVLIQAVRYFYYQRSGIDKDAAHAGAKWAVAADHVGPGQDKQARAAAKKSDPKTARDLHGGWWDAGDYTRYTNWHDDYLISLLHSYCENPAIFTDDFNIPESGNGLPDLIDEITWGFDWLKRMQNPDGSVLSILGEAGDSSPPAASTMPAYYGEANTSAALSSAAAFAFGAKVLARFPQLKSYAADLGMRARRAYAWAEAHPDVRWFNRKSASGDHALGNGEQEVSAEMLPMRKMLAAIYLFDLTGDAAYQNQLAGLIESTKLVRNKSVSTTDSNWLQPLLYYAGLNSARPDLVKTIRDSFLTGFAGQTIYGDEKDMRSPYLAWIPGYWWGSNKHVSSQGFFFLCPQIYKMAGAPEDAADYAAHYLHYLHGVNPLSKVYLSNMGAFGAENSVDEFYHSWFAKGSNWSHVKTSKYGPPPGYLVGGANQHYNWDNICETGDPRCGTEPPKPPFGQPPLKSYADFNDGWPINSWTVTEPSNSYQVEYIRLLTHFVTAK